MTTQAASRIGPPDDTLRASCSRCGHGPTGKRGAYRAPSSGPRREGPRTTKNSQYLRVVATFAVQGFFFAAASPVNADLTSGARLASVYETILGARFERVDAELREACPSDLPSAGTAAPASPTRLRVEVGAAPAAPPAPAEACQALRAVSLWWQILINPESRLLDPPFEAAATSAIAAADAWTRREPQRAEAWFYLAGSYGPRVQWRVLRGDRLRAALDGKKIKDALERAVRLDPALHDAYFGIGMYHYYADIAPAAAKILRMLLFLPGGDRTKGLREMQQARERGELLKGEADYQLQLIYLWYEHRPAEALVLLEQLDARYPANPLFRQRIAEVHDTYLHDHASSADAWRQLLARARAGSVYAAPATEVRARLGLASALTALHQTDAAIEQLRIVVDMHPTAPSGAQARAERALRAALARSTPR